MIKVIEFSNSDYNNSLYETYQLEYELFLIESDAFTTFGKINTKVIQEAYDDLDIIQESIKETMTLWIARFTEAMQKALDKFISVIEGARDLTYLKSIENSVKEFNKDPGFAVNNIREYDENLIKNFKIKPFDNIFTNNKDSLQNQEQFLIQNYPEYFSDGQTDISQVLQSKLVKVSDQQTQVNIDMIRNMYDWCRNKYTEDLNIVKEAMNQYNTSVKSISNIINQLPDDFKQNAQTQNNELVTPSNTQQQQQTESAFVVREETNNNATSAANNSNSQPSISNTSGATSKPNNPAKMTFDDKVNYVGKANGSNQETVNAVRNYLSCTTRIVSTLFIIIKNKKADYMRILKHLFPMNKEQQGLSQATVNVIQPNAANNVAQVDTSKF